MDQTLNPELNMDLDLANYKSRSEITVNTSLPDGKYHAVVESVEKDISGQNPALKFKFTVLEGPQKNRSIVERLFLTEKAKARVVLFADRLGMIGDADCGNTIRRNWGEAVGKQLVIEVQTREYKKADGSVGKASNLAFGGLFRLDDPAVADVPKRTAAAAAGKAQFPDI